MADFTLTAGSDVLLGIPDVADSFFVNAAGALSASDSVSGGTGASTTDRIVLGAAMTLDAAAFANVSGIERIVFNAGGGASITLADAMVAASHVGSFAVAGGSGADVLIGSAVATTALRVSGAGGNDSLVGGGGNDRIGGGSGHDTVVGGAGNDTLAGGSGNDRMEAGVGADRLDGGLGVDAYFFAAGALGVDDLVFDEGGAGDALGLGNAAVNFGAALSARVSGIERLVFGSGNDTFAPDPGFGDGLEGALQVQSGAGNDSLDGSTLAPLLPTALHLDGGSGIDTLVGARGNDTLDAGVGLGRMSGGRGNDLLIVRAVDLTGTVAIDGGLDAGAVPGTGDTLRIVGSELVGALQLANITGIEVVELDPAGGSIVVPDTLAAGVSFPITQDLLVRGSAEDDSVVTIALAPGRRIDVETGDGDDSVIGGAGLDFVRPGSGVDTVHTGSGDDLVIFAIGELGALDVVTADNVGGDALTVSLAGGRTLAASAFGGVTGIDVVTFVNEVDGTTAGVRLPSNLVAQSGLSTVTVRGNGVGDLIIDGRAAGGGWKLSGGQGDDLLLGGAGPNTIDDTGGSDTLVGGDGGDQIALADTGNRDVAVIRSATDGTADINGTLTALALAAADRVTGTQTTSNFIAIDPAALGLGVNAMTFNTASEAIDLGWAATILPTTEEIAGNAFGSLAAVQAVVGARLTGGQAGFFDRTVLVIGGADEQQFGVYWFEDRDDNATVDVADVLMLLAIGSGDVPGSGSNRGFTIETLDLG